MPTLQIRSINEVPRPSSTSKAVREAQQQYESYIQTIGSDVGELELGPGEQPRSVKVRLRRAATRLGREIQIWDADNRVYFKIESKRGRPRKSA